jgi:UPF0755 protein
MTQLQAKFIGFRSALSRSQPNPASQSGRFRLGMLLAVLAVLLSATGLYLWREYQQFSNTPLLAGNAKTDQTIIFEKGSGIDALLSTLDQAGMARGQRWQWRMLLRELNLSQKLKAGEYQIHPKDTARTLLVALSTGDVVQHNITFIEGMRFADLRQLLTANAAVKQTIGGLTDEAVMQKIGAPEALPEGLFLAETYRFPRGFTDVEILRKSYWDLQRVLKTEWAARAPELPLSSPYEALILASIVEKETGRAVERPQIAGVFTRRLKLNMRLQTDPTVIYGMGDSYDGNIRRKDLTTDTPFNTYTRAGLPPTPIAMPGKAAIHAALNPDHGKSLYFVAKGNGTHQFSDTYEAHDAAVDTYQR